MRTRFWTPQRYRSDETLGRGRTNSARCSSGWRSEGGDRQIQNAKVGLAANGSGTVRGEAAAASVHIVSP
jgi:hypothetical protein